MAPLFHDGDQLRLSAGRTIFDYADTLRVRVPTSCGRSGECHECIVEIVRGMEALSPPDSSEGFLRDDFRLACQAAVLDPEADVEFAVLRRQPRILTQSVRRNVDIDPLTVRRNGGIFFGDRRLDDYRGHIYGLAIDLGTTTVVLNLVDLESGEVEHTSSFENPQRFGGSDIMHRISYDGGANRGELQQVMLSAVNFEIGEMARTLRARGVHRRRIYEAVVVGNATMRDIFFGIDVQSIGEKPYKSLIELEAELGLRDGTSLSTTAEELGLRVFPQAAVYGGPLIGCHVGADVAAGILAVGLDEQDEDVMLVDVGTNTEVVVGNRRRMMAASCPAGPAFEGGQITYGMPGYDGAIESIELSDGGVEYSTIGGAEAQGICGSGLVDALAELRRTDRMSELGVFRNGKQLLPSGAREGHRPLQTRYQRARTGEVGQLLGPVHRPQAVRREAGRHIADVSCGGLCQLRQRRERRLDRLHRQPAGGSYRQGRQRRPGGRDDHAPVAPHARQDRRAGWEGGAHRAGDDARLLRHIRRGLHVQADGDGRRLAVLLIVGSDQEQHE